MHINYEGEEASSKNRNQIISTKNQLQKVRTFKIHGGH